MRIIQATELHINEVAVLFDAYRSYYDQKPDFTGALSFIAERIKLKDSLIFTALLDDVMIGFTQLYPLFTSVGMKRGWLLNDLFVLEAYRKKGAGKALIDAATAHGRQTKAAWLMLQTYIANTGAQALYEREGFKKDTNSYYYYRLL